MTAPWRTPIKYHDARDTPLDPRLQLRWNEGDTVGRVMHNGKAIGCVIEVFDRCGHEWVRVWANTTEVGRRFATPALAGNAVLTGLEWQGEHRKGEQ